MFLLFCHSVKKKKNQLHEVISLEKTLKCYIDSRLRWLPDLGSVSVSHNDAHVGTGFPVRLWSYLLFYAPSVAMETLVSKSNKKKTQTVICFAINIKK